MNNNIFSKYLSNPELLIQNLLDALHAKELLDLLDVPVLIENELNLKELVGVLTDTITDEIKDEVCVTLESTINSMRDAEKLPVIYDNI